MASNGEANGDTNVPNGKVNKEGLSPEAEKKKIMKNIILISVAFLMNFNAYQGLARLQSTLNLEDSIGVISSAVLYAALIVSCMFLPKIVINWLGHKWTIALMFLGYISWMAANGYPVWGTLIPTSILVGVSAAPLWTAQCSYFTIIAGRYAKLTGEVEEAVVSRFFGIFFFFFQLSAITGSVISSTIMKPTAAENETFAPIDDSVLQYCGADDCPGRQENNTNLEPVDSATRWTMVGIYIAIALAAVVLVALTVDNLPEELAGRSDNVKAEISQLFVATFKHLRHPNMLIIIPMTLYSGFEQASFNAEFTKSFVSCSLGIWKVGLVSLPFGVVNACVSFTSGYVIKYVGRIPVFLAGMFMDLAIQITLLSWMPTPDEEYVLYILAGMWGFTDGIWQTQINAFYGCIFKNESEAAFSNYRMWESFGFIIAFAYSGFICTRIKIIIIMCVLLVGMSGYLYIELHSGKDADDTAADLDENKKTTPDKYVVSENGDIELTGASIRGHSFQGKQNEAYIEDNMGPDDPL